MSYRNANWSTHGCSFTVVRFWSGFVLVVCGAAFRCVGANRGLCSLLMVCWQGNCQQQCELLSLCKTWIGIEDVILYSAMECVVRNVRSVLYKRPFTTYIACLWMLSWNIFSKYLSLNIPQNSWSLILSDKSLLVVRAVPKLRKSFPSFGVSNSCTSPAFSVCLWLTRKLGWKHKLGPQNHILWTRLE